jgi:hypothetical protein
MARRTTDNEHLAKRFEDELNSVAEGYKTKEVWNAALTKNHKRKERLTGKVIERLADLELHADSQPWAMGRAIIEWFVRSQVQLSEIIVPGKGEESPTRT